VNCRLAAAQRGLPFGLQPVAVVGFEPPVEGGRERSLPVGASVTAYCPAPAPPGRRDDGSLKGFSDRLFEKLSVGTRRHRTR
jgi:hypothetical protein